MKMLKQGFLILGCICMLGIAYFAMIGFSPARFSQGIEEVKKISGVTLAKAESKQTSILFVGDIMLSRTIGTIMEREGFDFPYAHIASTTQSADIAFANLETPVSVNGSNVGSIYSFRTDPRALAGLKNAGFDVVSIANNHMWDYGRAAFFDTITNLGAAEIHHAGGGATFAEAHAPAFIEHNGEKFAFLAYTKLVPGFLSNPDSAPAVAYPDPKVIATDVQHAKALGADAVIVSFHWGDEYDVTHNAAEEELAKHTIDAGALIVVGHHPHVAQEVETYNGGLIIYSLGNFIFDQNFSPDTRRGLIVRTVLEKGKIISFEPIDITFNKTYQPAVAPSAIE